jgi:hypothetical protein
MIRYNPTTTEKADALGSVFYELQQLWLSSHLIGEPQAVMNAFLESMLVHVRVLLDFFERDQRSTYRSELGPTENDDVLACDFGFQASPVDLNRTYRARLNKDLVHLAYSRNTRQLPDEKAWPRRDVVRPLIERAIEFIDSLDDATLDGARGTTVADWRGLRDNLFKMRVGFAGVITDI